METPVRKNYGLFILITFLVYLQVKSVNGNPTDDDYQNAVCPDDTIKCPPSAACCLKDSQVCSKRSNRCEEVFKTGDNEHDMCCNALRTNSTTKKGLIEVCKYRLGSLTWQEKCNEIKPPTTVAPTQPQQEQVTPSSGKPQVESSSTVTEIKPPTTGPTLQEKEQVTPSSEKPQVESSSTVTEIKLPTTGPTQQQKEQVTQSSEASSDWSLGVGFGVGFGVPLLLCLVALILCGVFADKIHLAKDKLIRKCMKRNLNSFADKSTSMTSFQCDIGSPSQLGNTDPSLSEKQDAQDMASVSVNVRESRSTWQSDDVVVHAVQDDGATDDIPAENDSLLSFKSV